MTNSSLKTATNPDHPAFQTPDGNTIFDIFNYSAAVRAGDFVYAAGQIGLNDDGSMPEDDATQFKNAFDRMKIVLEAAGASLDDVVELVSYHVGMLERPTHLTEFREVKDQYINAPFPTWTILDVAGLARAGLVIEIKAIAYCPTDK